MPDQTPTPAGTGPGPGTDPDAGAGAAGDRMAWLDGLRAIAVLVYLVHHVLIQLLSPLLTDLGRRLPAPAEIPVVAAYLGLLLGISWLTHRFVEVPGQRLGRRWARWMTIRWGSDARPAADGPGAGRIAPTSANARQRAGLPAQREAPSTARQEHV